MYLCGKEKRLAGGSAGAAGREQHLGEREFSPCPLSEDQLLPRAGFGEASRQSTGGRDRSHGGEERCCSSTDYTPHHTYTLHMEPIPSHIHIIYGAHTKNNQTYIYSLSRHFFFMAVKSHTHIYIYIRSFPGD